MQTERSKYKFPGIVTVQVLFLISIMFLPVSCREMFFNEKEITHEVTLDDFHSVELSGIFNVLLIQDSLDYIVISGSNSPDRLTAVVTDSILIIDSRSKSMLNTSSNDLEIHFSTLKSLVTRDPVNLRNRDTIRAENFHYDALGEIAEARLVIDCDFFRLVGSGNTLGSLHLSGKARDCYFFNRYGSRIFADSLRSRTTTVINESVGDVRVNASENILAFIHGPGDILYYGTPSVDIAEKKGTGNVIRIIE